MVDKIRYHAQRVWYSLCKRLGLMTRMEYEEAKDCLRREFRQFQDSTIMVAHNGSWFRREFIKYFDENKEHLHEKYLHLIDGLDEESCGTLQLALSRLMALYRLKSRGRSVKFELTSHEMLMRKKVADELDSKIIKFSDGLFAYKNWLLPHWEIHAEAFFYKHFIEELGCLQKIRGRDILDAGGFIGDSALVLQDYTDKKVYSFDPNPKNIDMMLKTVRLNNSGKIVPVALGLGDMEETLRMSADHVSGFESFSDCGASVNITTLDKWAAESGADIGLIKVDIEGYEQKFLKGALETIKRHRPAMLLCVYHNPSDLFEIKPFIEGLGLGYRFKVRQPVGHYIGEMTLVCEPT